MPRLKYWFLHKAQAILQRRNRPQSYSGGIPPNWTYSGDTALNKTARPTADAPPPQEESVTGRCLSLYTLYIYVLTYVNICAPQEVHRFSKIDLDPPSQKRPDYIWLHPDYILTTYVVRTKSGPTTFWLHTSSERSQARLHSDYTRRQNDVRGCQPTPSILAFPSKTEIITPCLAGILYKLVMYKWTVSKVKIRPWS